MRLSLWVSASMIAIMGVSSCIAADLGPPRVQEDNVFIARSGPGYSLGLALTKLSEKDSEKSGVENGALVLHVIEGSGADKAGLKKGDIIVEIDDYQVEEMKALREHFEDVDQEKKVKIVYLRDGKRESTEAVFEEFDHQTVNITRDGLDGENFTWYFHDNNPGDDLSWTVAEDGSEGEVKVFSSGGNFSFSDGATVRTRSSAKGGKLGIMAENISEQMLSYFEVEHGVLVESVTKDSPAEKSGLRAGDVITRINDREIKDFNDLVRTLNYYNPEETVTIHYTRKGSSSTTEATLAKKTGMRNIVLDRIGAPPAPPAPGVFRGISPKLKNVKVRNVIIL